MSDLDKIYEILLKNGIVDEKEKIFTKEHFSQERSIVILFDEKGDIESIAFDDF
jgi:hypothetical protein